MPIAAEHRWLYPIDWQQLSDFIRFDRAKGRCEHCRRPHGRTVLHLGEGTWWDAAHECWRDGRGRARRAIRPPMQWRAAQLAFSGFEVILPFSRTKVVLATAHLNHDPGDNRPRNLAALCQRCHMIHDAAEHRRRRLLNAFQLRALGEFDLPIVARPRPVLVAAHS